MKDRYARRIKHLEDPSASDALVLAGRKGIISFGGGIPDPTMFPLKDIGNIMEEIMDTAGAKALQYGPTAGMPELRHEIADMLSHKWKKTVCAEEIIITSGAQQALDLIGKAFLNVHDYVITEDPTYFVAISTFNSYEANYRTVALHADGPDIAEWERILQKRNTSTKFAYVIPTYQNPTGYTWSRDARNRVLELVHKYNLLLIEDDPYGELYFDAPPPASLKEYDTTGNILYLGTFSKVLSPGLRVGYIVARKDIINTLTLVKQSMDLHTSSLSQSIVWRYIRNRGRYQEHLDTIRRHYAEKARLMHKSLTTYLAGKAQWHAPRGGLFIWLTIPGIDTGKLCARAVTAGVSFMPGYPFYAGTKRTDVLRLTYATVSAHEIEQGIRILRQLL